MKHLTTIIAALLLGVTAIQAGLVPGTSIEDYLPTITVGTQGSANEYQFNCGSGEYNVEGTRFQLCAPLQISSGDCGVVTLKALEFDPDPTVFANQLIYNNTANAKTYNILISQPAYLPTSTSQVYGSIVVTLMDQAGDGGTLTDNGKPIYTASIDGNEVDTLLNDPYALTLPGSGNVSSGLQQFGWGSYGAGVNSSIAIEIELTLSAGDSATVQSRFDVIPEPASLVLIGITASAFTFVRRRFIS